MPELGWGAAWRQSRRLLPLRTYCAGNTPRSRPGGAGLGVGKAQVPTRAEAISSPSGARNTA
eukprot:11185185-Lingulodinium_polyedra.AAC.1